MTTQEAHRPMPEPDAPRLRLRIRYSTWPRPAIRLTDTPRPDCLSCQGRGGWIEDYGDSSGDYAGSTDVLCDCWTSSRAWTLLPLPRRPRWLRRRPPGGYSDEPPF